MFDLLAACEMTMQEPDPHISVGWVLGSGRIAMEQAVQMHCFTPQEWQQTVDTIVCMIGQRNTIVWSQA